MKKLTVIIAGDRRQAEQYARKVALFQNEWRYIDRWEQMQGLINFNIVYTGQYYLNKIYSDKGNREQLEMRSKMK